MMLGSSNADNDITISAWVSLSEVDSMSCHLPSTDHTRVESDTVPETLISYISTLGWRAGTLCNSATDGDAMSTDSYARRQEIMM